MTPRTGQRLVMLIEIVGTILIVAALVQCARMR